MFQFVLFLFCMNIQVDFLQINLTKVEKKVSCCLICFRQFWMTLTWRRWLEAPQGSWMCVWLLRASEGGSCLDLGRCSGCSGRQWSLSRCYEQTSSRRWSRAAYLVGSPSASPWCTHRTQEFTASRKILCLQYSFVWLETYLVTSSLLPFTSMVASFFRGSAPSWTLYTLTSGSLENCPMESNFTKLLPQHGTSSLWSNTTHGPENEGRITLAQILQSKV